MQRLNKPLIWLLMMTLIFGAIPAGLTQNVQAADVITSTRYFSPDILDLRKTISLSMEPTKADEDINRTSVYSTTMPSLKIEGSFTSVSGNSLSIVVQQIVPDTTKSGKDSVTGQPLSYYVEDPTHYTNGVVTVDPSSTTGQRFIADNLPLYPGYNKITFSGKQGELTRSESFYVLFDKVPYLQSLVVTGGGDNPVPLNEGTPVVVTESPIALQGVAQNATRVTVSVDNGTVLSASLDRSSGNFFASGLTVNPGINNLNINIYNDTDSVSIKRSIYLYDESTPFTGLYLMDGKQSQNLMENKPPQIVKELDTPSIIAQVVIPYSVSSDKFMDALTAGDATVKLKLGDSALKPAPAEVPVPLGAITLLKANPFDDKGQLLDDPKSDEEVVVPGSDGVTPQYHLVTFQIDLSKFIPVIVPVAGKTNVVGLHVTMDGTPEANFDKSISRTFDYYPDSNQIVNIYYAPKFNETEAGTTSAADMPDYLSKVSKESLDGATVNASDYYIMVESLKPRQAGEALSGRYLPLGTRDVNVLPLNIPIRNIAIKVNGKTTYYEVYKVTGFASGQQKVRLQFDPTNPSDRRDVTISFISKASISISNLQNGQSIEVDSTTQSNPEVADETIIPIQGQYIGFPNISSAEYFVNGLQGDNLSADSETGTDSETEYDLGVTKANPSFSLKLRVSNKGPLVYGENVIVFSGVYLDSQGSPTTVQTSLTIYITDKNGSTLEQFHPNVRPKDIPFPTDLGDATQQDNIDQILANSTLFTYDSTNDKYVTSQTQYDLVARGGGVSVLNFYRGSQVMFSINFNETLKQPFQFDMDGKTIKYDIVGTSEDFILRIKDIPFDIPGSQFYTLELVNDTGARTTKKIEIERVVEPFRVISPQPTSGDQIVVNKNFVHIDIEAAGATQVLIGKEAATPRADIKDRFIYDYVGLKPDKQNDIKIQIVRSDTTLNGVISVYYTTSVGVNTEYMAEKVSNKYTVFNKNLTLSFPKGTILQTIPTGTEVTKFYPDNKILFGIADPVDGAITHQDDYGNIINNILLPESNQPVMTIPDAIRLQFTTTARTTNFSLVSSIYWINGGLAEFGSKPPMNGVSPYSVEGSFTRFEQERKLVPSQRGTLTLAYDPNIVDDAGTTITVFRYDDGGIWENIGGEVDTKDHTVTVPFDEFGYYKVMKLRMGFADITNHGWARNILNALYSKGIMNNLRTDAFGTDDRTTRGEFATLLVKGLNLPINSDTSLTPRTFSDVAPNLITATYSYDYIETAARAGIITGQTDGFFGPEQPITREQAAVMIARALNLKLALNDDKLSATLAKSFVDSGSIDNYAKPAISAVSKAKIMTGSATTLPGSTKPVYSFNPKGYMSRAEAGKIAVELLKKSTGIFPKTFS
ncbi:S-layer homology domain-containing protein [Paenibacillus physcomitrellae]|uniref:SLH domain-containing protein n=1 Tax=Paenibacillus physcomitrellae TaxID=1619311 RepID=A0ABQ1GHT9_9BACL|nr:S-layer homology domain-containing protein [Paenibacillus physcomitrellae]GGA43905.1 hypothetical protein GCM10010917_31510 [Paenibacillus physcomitrellae]